MLNFLNAEVLIVFVTLNENSLTAPINDNPHFWSGHAKEKLEYVIIIGRMEGRRGRGRRREAVLKSVAL